MTNQPLQALKLKLHFMYVIAVYDCAAERTPKMLRLCRRYLHWIQNSVFEGEITENQLKKLKFEAAEIMDLSYDSFIVFESRNARWLEKDIIGNERSSTEQFL